MDTEFKILHREIFPVETVIIKQGTPGTRAYIIESGQVVIWHDVGGERRTLGVIGEGGIFGEMALIDNKPRMASVSALTDTTCVVISEEIFRKKLDEADPFVVGLLRIFVNNIRSLTAHHDAAPAADD